MKVRKRLKTAVSRTVSVLLLGALCGVAVLYQRGVFDFSFYNRNHRPRPVVTDDPSITETVVTTTPQVVAPSPEDTYHLQFVDALKAATNISGLGAGIMQGGEAISFDFPELSELMEQGYGISYADFDTDGNMLICKIKTDIDVPYDTDGYECQGLYFYTKAKDDFTVPQGFKKIGLISHSGIRLYMGYIICDDSSEQRIYSSTGKLLFTGFTDTLVPALTRDKDDNALFYYPDKGSDKFYYFDAEGKLTLSDYNEKTDNRGLYFDYIPTYGAPQSDLNIYNTLVTVITEITSQLPEREEEPEDITEAPATEAPEDTTDAEVTVHVTEEETAPPEDYAPTAVERVPESPSESYVEPMYSPMDEVIDEDNENNEDDVVYEDYENGNEWNDTTTAEETTKYVFQDPDKWRDTTENTTEQTEPVTEPVTEPITEPVTEPVTEEVTTTEPVTEAPKEPEYIVVDTVVSEEYRFAYGYNEWYRLTGYTFKEAYNYSDGYAAVVYPDNVMLFLTEWGTNHYPLYREKNYQSPNGRWAFSIYTAPLLRSIDAVGSFYFDRGYVRVRQLDTDAIYGNPDWLIGQYDLLLDENGNIFELPADYEIVGYSDGVLLLERDGLYGYYSTSGKWIAQPIYTFARPFAEGLGVIGFKNGIKGVIDTEGNVVIPFDYVEISQVSTGIIAAYSNVSGWNFFAKVTKAAE